MDENFSIGTGADDFVSSILVRRNGQILLGGGFTSFNGMVRYSVVQLNQDGTLDTLFDPGEGANAPVRAMAFQSDQSLLLAGEFTRYDGIERKHLVRVKESGSIDETLDLINGGPNGPIYSVATQLSQSEDGSIEKILVGGDFTMLGNYSLGRLARLNLDGTVDSSFESVQGADGTIHSILVQTD